jgi:hypothetical protein
MPEVREMLEWQMAPGNRSFEALSVIGLRLGLLYWIDKEWLAENAERLFRLEGIEETPASADGWAAWNAFLVWVSPHVEFYKLFKDQFAYAVQQSAHVQLSERTREQPMYSLGQHLVILYGRGQIGLDDDDAVLLQLLSNTQPDIRRHTIGFVGQSLGGDESLPSDIVERFQVLWDVYWSGPGKSDAADKPEAWLFGTWFSCGQFPAQWALEQLEAFVEIVPTPEPDHAVVQDLARIAHLDIVRSVHILDRMIRGDREGWRIHGWFDEAKRILQTAMNTGGEAQTVAIDLINYLGRRGHTDFGSVLASGPSVSKQ